MIGLPVKADLSLRHSRTVDPHGIRCIAVSLSAVLQRVVLVVLLAGPAAIDVSAQETGDAKLDRMMVLMQRFSKQTENQEQSKAAATLAEFLSIAEDVIGKEHPDFIWMEINRGTILRELARYDEATKQLETALQHATATLGFKHGLTGVAHNALGAVLFLKGDHDRADPLLGRAIEILESAEGDWSDHLVDALSNYAELTGQQGFLTEALSHSERALAISEAKTGRESHRTARVLNNLSGRYTAVGKMASAEETCRETLQIKRKLYGDDNQEVASALQNLARVLSQRQKYDEAIELFHEALPMAKRAFGPDHPNVLVAESNLGRLFVDCGKNEKAKSLLEQTLRRQQRLLGEDHPTVGTTKYNLALMHLGLRQYREATPLLRAAMATQERLGQHGKSAEIRGVVAVIHTLQGDVETAVTHFKNALQTANRAAWQQLPALSGPEQQEFMQWTYDRTLRTALSLGFRYPNDQAVRDATAEWIANGKGIAAEALAAARSDKAIRDQRQLPWTTIAQLRTKIPEGGVWIDIGRHALIQYEARSREQQIQKMHYVAWVVPKVGEISRIELGEASKIDSLIETVREGIMSASGVEGEILKLGEVEATARARSKLAQIAELVWRPIQRKLPAGTERIQLCPDGALWLLPWAALPVSSSGDDAGYLIQRYSIATYGSGRKFVHDGQPDPASASNSAIFSNPDFDQDHERIQSARQKVLGATAPAHSLRSIYGHVSLERRVMRLPGTALEAASIAPSMTKWLDGKVPTQFQGKFALESAAKQLVSPRGLVFATHGFYHADKNQAFDPLLRCGLLLAGCNRSRPRGDDGVLTGAEISEIDLRGTELVVLSACETGVGRIENGNGVAGLRRAFHLAGASSVVSTLWQVPDFDTAKLMSHFFAGVAAGVSKDEALREAQRLRIQSRTRRNGAAHPFYWAGFSISGG